MSHLVASGEFTPLDLPKCNLAQVNIAKLRAPIDSPQIADFANALDEVNALAEAAPGFVWRLVGEGNDATSLRPFSDPDVIVNMSVWESLEQLKDYVYRGLHAAYFKRRDEWFHSADRAVAAWWIRPGDIPTVDDAKRRVAFLSANGSSPYAFRLGTPQPTLTIHSAELTGPMAQNLITRLNIELLERSPLPGATFFQLDPAETAPGRGEFLVAVLDGIPVGCGAIRLIDDSTVEIKRMFVSPEARGHKIGAAVLNELEAAAIALGAARAVLETGPEHSHPEARTVYRKAGYGDIPCWGVYATAPHSYCYGKDLCPL